MNTKTLARNLVICFFFLILAILSFSVIRSGLFYQYDNDEVSHVQYAYLLQQGFAPYQDFHFTLLPLFHIVLSILFRIVGYTFDSLLIARAFMMVLFFLRIGVSYLLIKEVFHLKVAIIFIPLLLLDPFTVFTGMQIRPDNLMLFIFTVGLLILSRAIKQVSRGLITLAGVLLSLSCLVLLKIIPAVFVVFCLISLYCIKRQKKTLIVWFVAGMLAPLLFFVFYFTQKGVLPAMIQQTIIDRKAFNDALLNPSTPWFFYQGANFELFGYPGRPLTWVYVWFLPVAAFCAAVVSVYNFFRARVKFPDVSTLFKILLVVSLCVQWIGIVVVRGFFLQYFLLVSWLWAAFAAVFVVGVTSWIQRKFPNHSLKYVLNLTLATIFIVFTIVSVRGNFNRASVSHEQYKNQITHYWKIIPESEKTFPNILFRPFSYPFVLGTFIGDVPTSILRRYGPVFKSLERDHVKILLLNSYIRTYIDPETNRYIDANYSQMESEQGIYIRKT